MRQGIWWAALLVPAIFAVLPAEGEARGIARLAWLTGCWRGTLANGREYEEVWMRPAGGTMLGMSRTVAAGKTVAYEFLQIKEEGEALVYVAQPGGGSKVPFKSTRVAPGDVAFENLQHDFPQRVLYRTGPEGALTARIEGVREGMTRGFDFLLRRAGLDR